MQYFWQKPIQPSPRRQRLRWHLWIPLPLRQREKGWGTFSTSNGTAGASLPVDAVVVVVVVVVVGLLDVGCWLLDVVVCSWWLFLEMTYVTHALSILVLSLGRAEVPPWQFHQRHQLPAHEAFIVAWNLTCATCNVDLATMFPMMMRIWHTESARCLHPK